MALRISEGKNSLRMEVKVQPKASRNQILGEWEGALKVRLTAPPVEGEANQALLTFLAAELHISRRNISILRGESSRQKLLQIEGIRKEELLERLGME
ncbi:MAG TPA: DUF167 domain-containing protein [Syntrophomonadaceae bacterium]|nr:DUF167 domain-containing protein [Syntrophomonadaceae bacterium]